MGKGMFAKDRLYGGTRLDEWTDLNTSFVLWGAHVLDELVPTSVGDARKSILLVATMDNPYLVDECGTLASAIAEKVDEADESDFPAIVQLMKVKSATWQTDATVLQFVDYFKDDNGSDVVRKDTGEIIRPAKTAAKK